MSANSEPLNQGANFLPSGNLPPSIYEKLQSVAWLARRSALIRGAALTTSISLLTLLGTVVISGIFGLNSGLLRWLLCFLLLGATAFSAYFFFVRILFKSDRLLDAAWRIESENPAMEERLTSTVQFLSQEAVNSCGSGQLIDALTDETVAQTAAVDPDGVSNRSPLPYVTIAASISMVVFLSVILSPTLILTTLSSLVTPWNEPGAPVLAVSISPGNISVPFGDSVLIEATFDDEAKNPVLETIAKDGTVQSYSMAIVGVDKASFTLQDIEESVTYRIQSGIQQSGEFHILVHPMPRFVRVSGSLNFPEYTGIKPLKIERIEEPIVVPAGTEITIRAESDIACRDGRLELNGEELVASMVDDENSQGETASCCFEWKLVATDQIDTQAVLHLVSRNDVTTKPFRIKIHALKDISPLVRIVNPGVRQLKLRHTDSLPLDFELTDDYGISKVELLVQFGDGEPLAENLPNSNWKAIANGRWSGHAEFDFSGVPETIAGAKIWLRASDNWPENFGGSQSVESEMIFIEFTQSPTSIGEQQIEEEREQVEKALKESIERLKTANRKLDQAQDEKRVTENEPNRQSKLQVGKVSEAIHDIKDAKERLDLLADQLAKDTEFFQPLSKDIQQIADEELADALANASQIPLSDDPEEQRANAEQAKGNIDKAVDELERLKSMVNDRAEQLDVAAQLDELARQQEQLANEANDNVADDGTTKSEDDVDSDPVDEEWIEEQKDVADEIQKLVAKDKDALREQLLQQANEAEELSDRAASLGQQQENLGRLSEDLDRNAMHERQETKEQLRELIANEQEAVIDTLQKADREMNKGLANELEDQLADASQQMDETVKNLRNGKADQDAEKSAEQALKQVNEASNAVSKPQDVEEADDGKEDQPDDALNQNQDLDDLAGQQKNIRNAIKALNEDDLEGAANILQEQIAKRTERLKQDAKLLAEQNHEDGKAKLDAERAVQQLLEAQENAARAIQSEEQKTQTPGDQNQAPGHQNPAGKQNKGGQPNQNPADPQGAGDKKQNPGDATPQQQRGKNQDPMKPAPNGKGQQPGDQNQAPGHQNPAGKQNKGGQPNQNPADPQGAGDKKQNLGDATPQQQQGKNQDPMKPAPNGKGQRPGDKPNPSDQRQAPGDQNPGSNNKDNPGKQNKGARQNQNNSAKSLKQAAESLKGVCKNCRNCAQSRNGNSPANNGGKGKIPNGSSPVKAADPTQLAKAANSTKDAANSSTKKEAAKSSKEAANKMNKLANQAAESTGYSKRRLNRDRKPDIDRSPRKNGKSDQEHRDSDKSPSEQEAEKENGSQKGQNSARGDNTGNSANGVKRGGANESINGKRLRGSSTSNWTRSRRRLGKGVLDDKESVVPEQYRDVVQQYFEELARRDAKKEKLGN